MNDKTAEAIAGRCWDDPGMKHCVEDPTAAKAIAAVLSMVMKANAHRRGVTTVAPGVVPEGQRPGPGVIHLRGDA